MYFLDYASEVVLIVALHEFLLAEDFEKVFFLVCLLHGAFESAVAQHLVAVEVDFVYFHLVVLVDNDVDKHLVFVGEVFAEVDAHGGVAETFVFVVFGHDGLGAVHHVSGDCVAFHKLQPFLQLFGFAFLGSDIVHGRYARLCAQHYLEPRLVACHFLKLYLCLCEDSLSHKVFDGVRYVVAGNRHPFAHFKSGIAQYKDVFVVGRTFHGYSGNLVCARHGAVEYCRVVDGVDGSLRGGFRGEGCYR